MDGMRIMLGSLLPALWLLTSGQGHPGFESAPGGGRCFARLSISHLGHRSPFQTGESYRLFARIAIRRAWFESGPDDPFPIGLEDRGSLGVLPLVPISLAAADHSAGLAHFWQFQWRTAPEPRAPSWLS